MDKIPYEHATVTCHPTFLLSKLLREMEGKLLGARNELMGSTTAWVEAELSPHSVKFPILIPSFPLSTIIIKITIGRSFYPKLVTMGSSWGEMPSSKAPQRFRSMTFGLQVYVLNHYTTAAPEANVAMKASPLL